MKITLLRKRVEDIPPDTPLSDIYEDLMRNIDARSKMHTFNVTKLENLLARISPTGEYIGYSYEPPDNSFLALPVCSVPDKAEALGDITRFRGSGVKMVPVWNAMLKEIRLLLKDDERVERKMYRVTSVITKEYNLRAYDEDDAKSLIGGLSPSNYTEDTKAEII